MKVFINMDYLHTKMMSPALDGRPEAAINLNTFHQMASELEIVAKRETTPIPGIDVKNYSGDKVREIKISYEPHGAGGFTYGIRDYVIVGDKKVGDSIPFNYLGNQTIAIAEGTFTSLKIWEDFFSTKYRKELYKDPEK